jgi:hypothetical protein
MQSMHITTQVVSFNPDHGDDFFFSVLNYYKFVSKSKGQPEAENQKGQTIYNCQVKKRQTIVDKDTTLA